MLKLFPCVTPQNFFANAPGVLFKGLSFTNDMEKAWGCFRHLRTVFQELEECRAFELLKVGKHRSQKSHHKRFL